MAPGWRAQLVHGRLPGGATNIELNRIYTVFAKGRNKTHKNLIHKETVSDY